MLALEIRRELVSHGSRFSTDDMNTDVTCVPAGDIPPSWIGIVNGPALIIGINGGVLAILVRHTFKFMAEAILEAGALNIGGIAPIQVADEELKVTVVIGIELSREIDSATSLPVSDDGDGVVRHEVAADHVVDATLRVTAEAGAVGGALEVLRGFVDFPSSGRKIGFYSGDGSAVEAMGAVVGDGVLRHWLVGSAFVGVIGGTLARFAHHAVGIAQTGDCGEGREEKEDSRR